MSAATVHHGDALDVLRTLPDASVDAVVTDPPYGLADFSAATVAETLGAWLAGDREKVPGGRGFMGRKWDAFVPPPALWDEALRVLKPGGHVLAFAGSRTADLMGMSIRLGGFDVRDTITWHNATGFPKSMDVGKAVVKRGGDGGPWQGWGTALKPASVPILVGRKPLSGTVADNVVEHGTGALNVDACRIPHASAADLARSLAKNPGRAEVFTSAVYGAGRPQQSVNTAGRWPTNVVFTHAAVAGDDGELVDACVDGCVPGCPVAELDGHESDASRFFPRFRYQAKAPASERPCVDGVSHPTVKPLALMRFLVRLVCLPGGLVLDPFAGSGTTVEACLGEGMRCVAVEREEPYLPLIGERIDRAVAAALALFPSPA